MDMYDYLTSVFTHHPELMDWCDTLLDTYRHKHWDYLGHYLETFISLPVMQVCHQYQQKEAAINYLESVIEKLQPMAIVTEGIEEPILLINMEKAFFLLKNGDKKECKNLRDNCKSILDRMFDYNMDDCVYANYYRVSYEYHDDCNEYADSYKTGLLYLAYESLESIMATSKRDLACNLSICALLGDNVYNFQGLLEHPIVHVIEGMIDQVDGTINVTWVQPRVLGIPDVEILRDRLDNWLGKTERAIILLNPNEELIVVEDKDRAV